MEYKFKANSRNLTRGIIMAAIKDDEFRNALVKHHKAILPKLDIWPGINEDDQKKLMDIDWPIFGEIGVAQKWKKIALAWRPDGEFLTDWPHWVPPGPGFYKKITDGHK